MPELSTDTPVGWKKRAFVPVPSTDPADEPARVEVRPMSEYEVKWTGFDETTWELADNLTNCSNKIHDFQKQIKQVIMQKDMQKELPLPTLNPQPSNYYRSRKLYIHNYGFYLCNNGRMYCYVWNEYTGKTIIEWLILLLFTE